MILCPSLLEVNCPNPKMAISKIMPASDIKVNKFRRVPVDHCRKSQQNVLDNQVRG